MANVIIKTTYVSLRSEVIKKREQESAHESAARKTPTMEHMVNALTMAIRAIVEASCMRTRRLKGDLGTRKWNYNCVCKKEPRRAGSDFAGRECR